MLKVLFFARLREELDCPGLELPWDPALANLDALQDWLGATRGERWRELLAQDNLVRARNQSVVNGNCALHDGDEVAFFPPVTGG